MIVTGEHGSGKTAIVRAILNDLGYQIRTINFTKLGNIKTIEDFVENLLLRDNVYDKMQGKTAKKISVVIDEIESISTPMEKKVISSILKINDEIWGCPVIFIGSREHKKILIVLKEESYQIGIYNPDPQDMMDLLIKIGEGEKMRMEDVDVANLIIGSSQNDYRRMIITLQELKRVYNTDIITKEDIEKYILYNEERDINYTIYEYTSKLFSEYNGINSAIKIFENEKTNIPLMVQQNHFKTVNMYSKNKNDIINTCTAITNSIAKGDIVDNYIFSQQSWNLQETHGFYTCVYPTYVLNKNINKEKLSRDSKYPVYLPVYKPDYPKDLNKTSTRYINLKNVKMANQYFNNMYINDYIHMVKLIRNLLDDNRIEECRSLIKDYNLPYNILTYILKIDKINGTKKAISGVLDKKIKDIAAAPIQNSRILTQKASQKISKKVNKKIY